MQTLPNLSQIGPIDDLHTLFTQHPSCILLRMARLDGPFEMTDHEADLVCKHTSYAQTSKLLLSVKIAYERQGSNLSLVHHAKV